MNTIAFFNNRGGVGKTTLVFHLGHMFAERGHRVLMVDLDPQSNLTAMSVSEDRLETLWEDNLSIQSAIAPLIKGTGDVAEPHVEEVGQQLHLVAGDLAISRFEDRLSDAWPRALDRQEAALRTLSAFHRITRLASDRCKPDLVLLDLGPNLGAINRAAMLGADHLITPLAPDLFTVQGLKNLGPTLRDWRHGWKKRLEENPSVEFPLPQGKMAPLGYLIMQAGMRLSRPVRTYQRWVDRMPNTFHEQLLQDGITPATTPEDPACLGVLRNYQSLMPLAQDARKPMFALKPGDGALGAHQGAVRRCWSEFNQVAETIEQRLRPKKKVKRRIRKKKR